MGRFLKHIVLPLVLSAVSLASCRNEEAKVIPRDKLADIYAEMLMTDQWVMLTPGVRMIADTSLVYAPILEKYGFTTADYVKSVDFYMNDPERYARILRTTSEIITDRLEYLREQKKQLLEEQRKKRERERLRELYQTDLHVSEFFPYISDEPYVHYYDSLSFEKDSLMIYRLKSIERADTLYDRIRMVIRGEIMEPADESQDSVESPEIISPLDSIIPPKRPLKRPSVLQGVKLPEKIRN